MNIKNAALFFTTAFFMMQSLAIARDVQNLNSIDGVKNAPLRESGEIKNTTDNKVVQKKDVLGKSIVVQDFKITLGLSSNLQFGSTENNAADGFVYKNFNSASGKMRSSGFVTNNKIILQAENIAYDDFKYGAYIKINADTSRPIEKDSGQKNPIGDKMMLFVESDYGRFEAGTYDGAHDRIKVGASSVAVATDGIAGDWGDWIVSKGYYLDNSAMLDISSSFVDSASLPAYNQNARANKVTYYTPKWNGWTFGISYIPDAQYTGTADQIKSGVSAEQGSGYRNVVESGVRYETKLQDLGLTFSAMTEFGAAKKLSGNFGSTGGANVVERNNLAAWEVGAKVDYKQLSFAASYGNLGKSGTAKNANPNPANKVGADYWAAGLGYKYNKFAASLTYLRSKSAGLVVDQKPQYEQEITNYNRAEVISLGMEYLMFPSLSPYAEFTKFSYSRPDDKNVKGNNGFVFLVGAKLKF